MNNYCIISFPSSHHAIRGEKVAEEAYNKEMSKEDESKAKGSDNVKEMRLIPTPPEVSAGCGLVLRLPQGALNCAFTAFKAKGIEYEEVFSIEETNANKVYTLIENL